MITIAQAGFAEQTITKSRFISMAVQCTSEPELGSAFRAFAAKYPNAHHLAYAFRIKLNKASFKDFQIPVNPLARQVCRC